MIERHTEVNLKSDNDFERKIAVALGLLAMETAMSSRVTARRRACSEHVTDALIDLAHYMPTLQREVGVFAETRAIDDGQRTLQLGRHIALKLKRALDEMEQVLPK